MNWPASTGWLVFVAVPVLLWGLGGLANKGHGFAASAFAFVVGSDGRLSLSRLQAFLWTLVIFGSFFAAMAIHTPIALDAKWVQIPPALLALAGIAVGSGVFSSLIAAVNSDQKTASVTAISPVPNDANFRTAFPNAGVPENANALLISGTLLGDGGKVGLGQGGGKKFARILFWNTNGTQILVDLLDNQAFDRLIIETPNGKLTYDLGGTTPNFALGRERINYEFADLFRDDKNPENLSLMKFQMFGWTVVAIFIYVYLFLSNLSATIATLPTVDSSIAVLTGVSQAGYLAGKGVSNIGPSQ